MAPQDTRTSYKDHLGSLFLLALLLASTVAVYWPGLNGFFILDDYENLQALNNYGGVTDVSSLQQFVFGNTSGITGRPVAMLSFLIDDQYWPGDIHSYRYTNLMIHLLCGLFVMLLAFRLCMSMKVAYRSSSLIALLAAALWLLHPLNTSTTLYVIQRMTQLMTLFTLAGLVLYSYGRTQQDTRPWVGFALMTTGVLLFGALATLSKENGILIVAYVLVLEVFIFSTQHRTRGHKIWLALLVGLPIILGILYLFANWGSLANGYQDRDFTLYERLLTEGRVLVQYLSYILIPRNHGLSLTHDDIQVSTGILHPISTLISLIIIIALAGTASLLRNKQPVLGFAILWFFAGQVIESTVLPLELYFEHRNYMPMIGPIFAAAYYLVTFVRRPSLSIPLKIASLSLPLAILLIMAFQTHSHSMQWSQPGLLFSKWASEHPDSARASRLYAQYLIESGQEEQALTWLQHAEQRNPRDLTIILMHMHQQCLTGRLQRNSLPSVAHALKVGAYSDGLTQTVSDIIKDNGTGRCRSISLDDLHVILAAILSNNSLASRDIVVAKLLFDDANIYVKQRLLNPAMSRLDEAFKHQHTIDIPLYQAQLLASAGLYNDALQYLDIAKRADSNRRPLTPSRLSEIDHSRRLIMNAMNR